MATPAAPVASAPPAAGADAPPKKKSKLLLIALGAVVLLAAGGGGGWYYVHQKGAAEGKGAEAHPVEAKTPVFVTLDPFTVNLREENGERYLQAGIVFQVTDAKVVDAIKTYMPVLRSRILLLLSGKLPSELVTPEGKQKLVTELIAVARESVPGLTPEHGIDTAHLGAFVVQ